MVFKTQMLMCKHVNGVVTPVIPLSTIQFINFEWIHILKFFWFRYQWVGMRHYDLQDMNDLHPDILNVIHNRCHQMALMWIPKDDWYNLIWSCLNIGPWDLSTQNTFTFSLIHAFFQHKLLVLLYKSSLVSILFHLQLQLNQMLTSWCPK